MTAVFLLIILTGVNAFFTASEMAFITINDNKIRFLADEGDLKAKKVLTVLETPTRFLSTIQIGVTLAGFLASAFASDQFSEPLVNFLITFIPIDVDILETISVIIITLLLSYTTLVFGELVPKRVAMSKAEPIAFAVVGTLRVISIFALPFVNFLSFTTNSVLRLLGFNPDEEPNQVTEEEIRMMVDVGSETGGIENSEKEMIQNIFEFNDKEVSEIMTHRKKIIGLPLDSNYETVMAVVRSEKFTRIPVYRDNIDDIVGILHITDLIGLEDPKMTSDFSLSKIIREPLVVHETRKISSLFSEMKTCGMQMAVIVDEYGGTMGICTIEDMLEEIVGNITDEFDEEEQEFIRLSNGDYVVAGDMTLSDLENVLGIELTDEEYDTIAGLVIQLLDRVPEEGEKPTVTYKNLSIKVLHVQERWISKVMIHPNPIVEKTDKDDEEKDKED